MGFIGLLRVLLVVVLEPSMQELNQSEVMMNKAQRQGGGGSLGASDLSSHECVTPTLSTVHCQGCVILLGKGSVFSIINSEKESIVLKKCLKDRPCMWELGKAHHDPQQGGSWPLGIHEDCLQMVPSPTQRILKAGFFIS